MTFSRGSLCNLAYLVWRHKPLLYYKNINGVWLTCLGLSLVSHWNTCTVILVYQKKKKHWCFTECRLTDILDGM